MGWYDGDHMSGWGWFGMTAGSILFVALLVLGAVLVVRLTRRQEPPTDAQRTPEQVLAERFARGEIDEDECRRHLAALRSTGALSG